ncbi:MAG: hypothetical protein AB7Q01_02275 [Gammaproteobacteria bacterium]
MDEDSGAPLLGGRAAETEDDEIGRTVAEATRALNLALLKASQAGLDVELSVTDHAEPGLTRKSISVHLWRRIRIV